jgi:hypothetical protein
VASHAPALSQFTIQKLDFEGDYYSLVKVLNQLQQAKAIGMIRTVTFKTAGNPSVKAKRLLLEVYFEIVNN